MPTPDEFCRFVRARTNAVLQANDQRRRVCIVTDRVHGTIVLPMRRVELEADELVLFVPDEGEGGAQVLVSAAAIDEGRSTDRWLAYHGSPDAPHWCALHVEAARLSHELIDAAIDLSCPFADGEPAICKRANGRTKALSELGAGQGVHDDAPVLVGVDSDGFDLRARTGIVRFDFEQRATTAAEAAEMIDGLLNGSNA